MPTTATSKLGWDIGSAFNEMGKCRKYPRLEDDGSGSAVGGGDGNSLERGDGHWHKLCSIGV